MTPNQSIKARDISEANPYSVEYIDLNSYRIKSITNTPNSILIVIKIIELSNPPTTAPTSPFTLTITAPGGYKAISNNSLTHTATPLAIASDANSISPTVKNVGATTDYTF